MSEVVVIGAGVGGLSAAIDLASRGARVRVLEAQEAPGGKAGVVSLEGAEVDTGPSLLTLPEVFDGLFRLAGSALEREVELLRPSPAFRYLFPDGAVLDLHHEVEATLDSVGATLGAPARAELARFLRYARGVWDAGAPNFVYGEAPSIAGLLGLALRNLGALTRIDAARTMWSAIQARVRDERLRWLLARYATYNGSSPYEAPATLNCIAHVELALGGFGVSGGIAALVRALVRAAEGLGVVFDYGCPAEGIELRGGRVAGVRTGRGLWRADAVVANAEAAHVAEVLLGGDVAHGIAPPDPPSMSGWTAILRARRGPSPRPAHTVLFPERYAEEFRDIFERDTPPDDPTVYLCAQESCHGRPGWAEDEPVFVMVNAPPEAGSRPRDPVVFEVLERRVRARLERANLAAPGDRFVWRRSPAELAARFPGSRGSIYGAASNGALAAFRRPANRVAKVPGLYLASGSAHPGGGLPLVALSGRAAARAAAEDLGLERAPAPAASPARVAWAGAVRR